MIYEISFTDKAKKDIEALRKSELAAYNKVLKLLIELAQHPQTGTGNPKMLKHKYSGFYSRRITQKHRLVYSIDGEEISVLVISAMGHYDDK